jgi:hypothetical protein
VNGKRPSLLAAVISFAAGALPAAGALLAAGAGALATGCAPSLSTMQPAHVAPKGHFEATMAVEISAPTGTISRVIDAGKDLSNQARMQMDLTPQQEQQVFEAGVNVVVVPPSAGYHLAIAYTVLDHWELNLRYAGGGWRLGTRYQILRHEDGPLDLTVGAGVARAAFEIPLGDYIPILEVDDFTRWTVDVAPFQIGTSRSWYRVWLAPRFLYSHFTTALRLSIPGVDAPDLASFEGHTIYYGGQGGVALGYRHIFFGVELTLAQVTGTGTVTAASDPRNGGSEPIARTASLDGFVIFPAFGLMGEF